MLDGGIFALQSYLALAVTTGKLGGWAKRCGMECSVGMVCNVEGLCCRSSIVSSAFILALSCKPIHLQK